MPFGLIPMTAGRAAAQLRACAFLPIIFGTLNSGNRHGYEIVSSGLRTAVGSLLTRGLMDWLICLLCLLLGMLDVARF